MLKLLTTAILAALALTVNAQASSDPRYDHYGPVATVQKAPGAHAHRVKSSRRTRAAHRVKYAAYGHPRGEPDAAQILPHPDGCPARSFCGCGAAIEVFGRNIREAWLAAWWYRFPVAAPAPGMVAVRRHHVFVIREVRGPGLVLAYDANSGGRQTRLHLRSLAGYSVRNPRGGSRYATAL